MPKYLYKCSNCDAETAFYHSMTETREDCDFCQLSLTLERITTKFNTFNRSAEKKTGDVVKNSIKEIKEEMKQEKQRLENEFYNQNK